MIGLTTTDNRGLSLPQLLGLEILDTGEPMGYLSWVDLVDPNNLPARPWM